MILHSLAKNWWLVLLRGIAAIVFGIFAFQGPGLTLLVLVTLWGAYALVDGVLALMAAIAGGGGVVPRWWLVVAGLAGIAAGIVTFFSPGMTALVLITVIGVWAVVRGLFEIVGAIQLRKEIDNEWFLIASGMFSVIFGVMVLAAPGAGALALVWVIGAYAVVFGVMLVALSLRLRRHRPALA
jgi:uncharacterized membrane protein HdeD (DUF308 family)